MGRPSQPFLIGAGLKMYLGHAETIGWVRALRAAVGEHPALSSGAAELVVLPSFLSIDAVTRELAGSRISVGAQDVSEVRRGPFTGEVSVDDLVALGCSHVEVGHAERRARHGETDEAVAAKVETALAAGLVPIVCVGEQDDRGADDAQAFCRQQVRRACAAAEFGDDTHIAIAYEPIWAIGKPHPARPEHITAVCAAIGEELAAVAPRATRTVIYGGSARPGMLADLDDGVQGLFMGRSSHDVANVAAALDEVAERAA